MFQRVQADAGAQCHRGDLQLLDLLLVPALLLFALLPDGGAVVLQRLARVLVFFLDRPGVGLVFAQARSQPGDALL